MSNSHWILAFYYLEPILDPKQEVIEHKAFLEQKDVTARIYISEQGINAQMSAAAAHAQEYINWMNARFGEGKIDFKIHLHHEHVFPRLTIKYRKQLVAIDRDVDFSLKGEHVAPKRWKEMLESGEKRILIDVRNDYEWKIGHFEGAELPACANFREFTDYAEQLKETNDPTSTPVMMYCTGGIRCELYSAVLKEKGFKNVYQLEGGVIGYGLREGDEHWQGKLFVFDDRLAIPLSENHQPAPISHCHHCGTSNDTYYNCANMDCNQLFLCCSDCAKSFKGCCCKTCMTAPRLRPYRQDTAHKPFRRKGNFTEIAKNAQEGI